MMNVILKGGGIKKWLAIVAGLLLVFGAIIYGNKIGVSADDNDTDFLANIQDKPDLNDPTIIRLPGKYSKDDIQKAVNNQAQISTKALSSKDKEISDYIRKQENKIAKNLPLKSGTKEQPAMNDLVFRVADSKSQIITPTLANNKAVTKVVEGNFEFDPSVTDLEKNTMIQAYPLIESIFGLRQNTRKITVVKNMSNNRAWCSGNHIELASYTSAPTVVHELAHAFRGDRMLNSLWEEGSAVFIEVYVSRQLNLLDDSYGNTQLGYTMNYENLPSTYDPDIWSNGWGSHVPYAYGSMVIDKIMMEDAAFLKKFNQRLYAAASRPSRDTVLKMAISSVSKIEGEDSWSWFSHQYPYIEYYQSYSSVNELYYSNLENSSSRGYRCTSGGYDCQLEVGIFFSYDIKSSDFDIKLTDVNGGVLVGSPSFNTAVKDDDYIRKVYQNLSENYLQYQGLVYVEIIPTSNPSNNKKFSFLKTDELPNYWDGSSNKDVLIYSKTGNIAVLSEVGGTNRIAVPRQNGYFSLKTDWVKKAGKFRVEIYNKKARCSSSDLLNCLGARADIKYFNKGENRTWESHYINLGEKNICGGKVGAITPLNRSVLFYSSTQTKCGQVVSMNRIPMYRLWGTSFSPTISDLARGKSYQYVFDYASDLSKITKKVGNAVTSSYTDFRLLKSQSFGSPLNNTFYQRLTFSSPYDPKSLGLTLYQPNSDSNSAFAIRQVSDKVFDLVPNHTYNNYNYYINNLNMVKDTYGNPLYDFNWGLASFQIPMNPLGAGNPTFTLDKENYSPNDRIIISKNFISRELTNRLAEISLYRETEYGECQPDSTTCGRVELSVSIINDQIVIIPQQPMISGKYYRVSLPIVVDDSNNIVIDNYYYGGGHVLGFKVN